jgi:asparagine synthase (glutamine-hydrolysing)
MTVSRWFPSLDRAWGATCSGWKEGTGPLVVLFSGGVDSGLLAWELRSHPDCTLHTIGVVGTPEWEAARSAASALGSRWTHAPVDSETVLATAARIATEVRGLSPTLRSVQVAVALALASAPPGEILCGQGADELFLGYAHFRALGGSELARRARSDLERLVESEWPRTVRIARGLGRSVSAPYLAPAFVSAAGEIPLAERAPAPEPKHLFREWAVHRGVPRLIAGRAKRALQFGSGVDRILSRPLGDASPRAARE